MTLKNLLGVAAIALSVNVAGAASESIRRQTYNIIVAEGSFLDQYPRSPGAAKPLKVTICATYCSRNDDTLQHFSAIIEAFMPATKYAFDGVVSHTTVGSVEQDDQDPAADLLTTLRYCLHTGVYTNGLPMQSMRCSNCVPVLQRNRMKWAVAILKLQAGLVAPQLEHFNWSSSRSNS